MGADRRNWGAVIWSLCRGCWVLRRRLRWLVWGWLMRYWEVRATLCCSRLCWGALARSWARWPAWRGRLLPPRGENRWSNAPRSAGGLAGCEGIGVGAGSTHGCPQMSPPMGSEPLAMDLRPYGRQSCSRRRRLVHHLGSNPCRWAPYEHRKDQWHSAAERQTQQPRSSPRWCLDTAGPRITSVVFRRGKGTIQVAFEDFVGWNDAGVGLDRATAADAVNVRLAGAQSRISADTESTRSRCHRRRRSARRGQNVRHRFAKIRNAHYVVGTQRGVGWKERSIDRIEPRRSRGRRCPFAL